MKNRMNFDQPPRRSKGQVIVFFAISLTVIMTFAGLAVDLSHSREEQRRAQNVADAASLSAAQWLGNGQSVDQVRNEAHRIVQANNFSDSDLEGGWQAPSGTANSVNTGGIQVGTYASGGSFTVTTTSPNAVRVKLRRSVVTTLARAIGLNALNPRATSVAWSTTGGTIECGLQFGIDSVAVQGGALAIGSNFTVGFGAPGNWGTLNKHDSCDFFATIDHTGSCGNSCGDSFSVGCGDLNSCVPAASPPHANGINDMDTGNGNQIRDAFNRHIGSIYVFPVINFAGLTGNSSTPAIFGFIRAKVVQAGGNGSKTWYQFQLMSYVTAYGNTPVPPSGTFGKSRILVQ